ncbi:MAG: hypothetical protein SGILL_008875 [Bacillariaceae sp.]
MSSDPAVSADASISKATAVTTDMSLASNKQPVVDDDDKSIEEELLKQGSDDDDQNSDAAAVGSLGDLADLPDFTPPLRIHAIRGSSEQPRLTGSQSQLSGLPNPRDIMRRRKNDSSALSSRSGSESPGSSRGHYKHYDGGSSISSLEDAGIDFDVLTDRMGHLELDLQTQQEISHGLNKSLSNLPAVNERMSDETMDDVHAFSDVKRETGTLSRGGSITTGGEVSSTVLEPLEEIEEQEDDNEGEGNVKITNLQEILEGDDEEEQGAAPSS